jgi:hypothetical protein
MKPSKNGILFALVFALPVYLAYVMALSSSIAVFGTGGQFLGGLFAFIWLMGVLFFHSSDQQERRLPTIRCLEMFEAFRDRLAESGLKADWEPYKAEYRITISGLVEGLSLSKEGPATNLAKQVQGKDVEVGQESFDEIAYIRGDELELLSRLDAGQRERIERLLTPVRESVDVAETAYTSAQTRELQYHWGLTIEDGVLSFPTASLEDVFDRDDIDDLIALAESFAATRPGTREERLVELVRRDEDLQVSQRILSVMAQRRGELDLDFDALLVELIRGPYRPEDASNPEPMTEEIACNRVGRDMVLDEQHGGSLRHSELGGLAAALWLRDHAESKTTIPVLADALARVQDGHGTYVSPMFASQRAQGPATAALSEALATLRSRLDEFSGGLAVAESQDAGALSVAEPGGKLALAEEGGTLSLAEEEARRKQLGAMAAKRQR